MADAHVFRGLIGGVEGESILNQGYGFDPGQKNELPELLQKVESASDDRLYAIVAALVVENRLERVLVRFFPRVRLLLERQEFTTSMRITVLRALELLPDHILRCADLVRIVRNEYAHNLDVETFEALEKKSYRSSKPFTSSSTRRTIRNRRTLARASRGSCLRRCLVSTTTRVRRRWSLNISEAESFATRSTRGANANSWSS